MNKIIICIALTGILAGCASRTLPIEQAKNVPDDKIYSTRFAQPAEGAQKVTVIRTGGSLTAGGGARYELLVDGVKVASMSTDERVDLYLPRGEHMLSARNGLWTSIEPQSIVINIPSRYRTYRLDSASAVLLQPAPE
ncbi:MULTISPECIES: hypothetical protein [Burkholderia cepacia complex]|uniref:hypothetical protein n=1 Tax=Burkholderia cepacia complex TaxID=87882 RepID=UPI0012D92A19|nr:MULTISPECIES: hypothetical protein [Burkholderia cepacia complex]MBR8188782.1 hypothetical protein [Burkholderia vietnamiensis]